MNVQSYNINLRVGTGITQNVKISQGDVGRELVFYLYDGAVRFSPPSGATVKIKGTKPSGLGFDEICTLSGNVARVFTTLAMTQEGGNIPAELEITNGSVVIGTANFRIYAEPSPHPAGTTDGTTEEARTVLERCEQYAQEAQVAAEAASGDYTEVRSDVDDLKADIIDNNSFDFAYGQGTTGTSNGVTYTKNSNGTWKVNGTSTNSSFRTVISGLSGFDNGMKAGGKYTIRFSTEDENVTLRVYPYYSGSIGDMLLETIGDTSFTIPSGASGVGIRLFVASGKTITNAICSVKILTAPSQNEISDSIENIKDDIDVLNTINLLSSVDVVEGLGTTGTNNGVTYTNNNDGTWSIVGTATAASFRTLLSGLDNLPSTVKEGQECIILLDNDNSDVAVNVYPYYGGTIGALLITTKVNASFTVPFGVSGLGIRFTVANGKTVNATVKVQVLNTYSQSGLTNRVLNQIPYQRKIAFFGDSIMWGRDGDGSSTTRVVDTIPKIVAKRLNVLCDNFGVGGMGYLRQSDAEHLIAYDKISSIDISGYDVIVLCFGVNDGFQTVGAYDSTDETTCLGQFNKIINYIYTQNATSTIIVFAPYNGINAGSYPDYWYGTVGGNATSRSILSNALKTACEYYWIPYVEQKDSPINAKNITTALPDGVHPSESFYHKIGDWFTAKLRNLVG